MISESKLPIKITCETLGCNRSSYYMYGDIDSCHNSIKDMEVKKMIEKILKDFPCYGYKRVTKQLQRQNQIINHKRVYRIMSENNLLYNMENKFKVITTDSNHGLPVYRNLIKDIEITRLNHVWVADITYILLPKGHIYLAAILDMSGFAGARSVLSARSKPANPDHAQEPPVEQRRVDTPPALAGGS